MSTVTPSQPREKGKIGLRLQVNRLLITSIICEEIRKYVLFLDTVDT